MYIVSVDRTLGNVYIADGTKKSLNSLSQKFLMMFLVAQPQVLNLDLCARVLIGDAVVDHSDLGKFKSKLNILNGGCILLGK